MSPENLERAGKLLTAFPQRSSALIPILHLVEEEHGYIPPEEVDAVAELMGITPAYVESVLSFYTLFHRQPTGKYLVQVCRGLSCAVRGADELAKYLYDELGVQRGGTTEDGMFTVEEVECIALCREAPAVQVNLEFFGHVDREEMAKILHRAREGVQIGA